MRHLTITLIYRPPALSFSKFLYEFENLLECLCGAKNHLITGDFNVHLDDTDNAYVKSFLLLINQYGFTQHVSGPTHSGGHTLDLILSRSIDNLIHSVSVHDCDISDHSLVLCDFSLSKPSLVNRPFFIRRWRKLDIETFRNDLLISPLCDGDTLKICTSPDALTDLYNTVMKALVDKHVPLTRVYIPHRKCVPWFSNRIKLAIRLRRKYERHWRMTKKDIDKQIFFRQRNIVKTMVKAAKYDYYSQFVSKCSPDPKSLWSAIHAVLHDKAPLVLPSFSPDTDPASAFVHFFTEKIASIREKFCPSCASAFDDNYSCESSLSSFTAVSIDETIRLLALSKPKTCMLDPVPTWLVKKLIHELAPVFCTIANLSLGCDVIPVSEKRALVTPILKKSNLCKVDMKNYRPVSNLSFLSKFIERIVSARIDCYLLSNSLFSEFQSAYRLNHSTESVIIHVANDLAAARSKGFFSCLLLLDLSSAFDTVDHDILLERLSLRFGFTNHVIDWFRNYLTNRTQAVCINNRISDFVPLTCGVPQGSVLGPRLYSLYIAPVSSIIESYNLSHHVYADDTCIYLSLSSTGMSDSLLTLKNCTDHLFDWFNVNRLQLNPAKSEIIFFSPFNTDTPDLPDFCISEQKVCPSSLVKYLGVFFRQ